MDAALAEYADRLERAGFTIYEPVGLTVSRYFRYSRVVDGKECFGCVQKEYAGFGYSHTMPIEPSIENGSAMWVDGVRGELTVEAAMKVARPKNRNPLVGLQANYDDPRFRHLYHRRTAVTR